MSQSVCRWGFLGAAVIARKNWQAVQLSGNGRVVALASRDLHRARTMIAECEAEAPFAEPVAAMDSYDELLARDDIDAVYIPLPTGVRKSWVLKAAAAGKHVLCEKPIAINAADAKEMITACQNAGVQFIDGVMFDHSARLDGIRGSLDNEARFGRMRRIQTHFSFLGDDTFADANIRAQHQLEPHGCLGDLGWYCIRFTLWALQGEMPTRLSARTLTALGDADGEGQVPGEFAAELQFPGGISAGFYCSFLSSNQQTALVSGEHGYVTVDDFVLPFYGAELSWTENVHVLEIMNCRWNFRRHTRRLAVAEYSGGEANAQEVQLFRRMGEIALSGQLDDHFPTLALQTQQILDACRRSAIADGDWIEL